MSKQMKTGVLEQIRFFKIKVSCSTGRSKGNCSEHGRNM